MTTQTERSGTFREDESRGQSPELRKLLKGRDEDIAVDPENVSVSNTWISGLKQ